MTEVPSVARIRILEVEELDQELQAMVRKWAALGGDDHFIRAFGHLPDRLKAFVNFYSPLVRHGLLPCRLKELVRLKIAQLNNCHF